jgi:hypothetical protein
VHYKPIIVSKILDATVEVTEGIATTDRIVNNPSAALLEGNKIRIVTPVTGYHLVGKETPPSKDAHGSKEASASKGQSPQ